MAKRKLTAEERAEIERYDRAIAAYKADIQRNGVNMQNAVGCAIAGHMRGTIRRYGLPKLSQPVRLLRKGQADG